MADAEVTAYQMLYGDPNDSTIGQTWDGQVLGEAFDPASIPVVPLIVLRQRASGGRPRGPPPGSLWTAQAWGPGGLQKLADYPSARQAINEQKWWPPCRGRATGLGPRMRFDARATPRGGSGSVRRFTGAGLRTAPSTRAPRRARWRTRARTPEVRSR